MKGKGRLEKGPGGSQGKPEKALSLHWGLKEGCCKNCSWVKKLIPRFNPLRANVSLCSP